MAAEGTRRAPRRARPSENGTSAATGGLEIPNVGEIIQRLRLSRGMSLQDAADATGLSASFLSAVERGKSDIALKRLARVAHAFGHDVGSLLGYTARRAKPVIVDASQRFKVDRGKGIDTEVVRLPGMDFEFVIVTFSPGSRVRSEMSHEGVDIAYVVSGEVVLTYNGIDYALPTGSVTVYSGGYPHAFHNDARETCVMVGVTTENVY